MSGSSFTSAMSPEIVRDTIAAALQAGANITITHNDASNVITISASTDPEVVRDTIAAALVAGSGVTLTPNDAGDTITIASTATGGSTDPEVVRDTIAAALVAGTGISITPNDAGDSITIGTTAGPSSALPGEVLSESEFAALQAAGNEITNTDYVYVIHPDPVNPILLDDEFARTTANGWGGSWTITANGTGGAAADWSTSTASGGYASALLTAANQDKTVSLLSVSATKLEIYSEVSIDKLPTAASGASSASLFQRYHMVDGNNYYRTWLAFNNTGSLSLTLGRASGGTVADLTGGTGVTVTGVTVTPGAVIGLRTRITQGTSSGFRIQARAWLKSGAEPSTWNKDVDNNTEGPQGSGYVGLHLRNGGSTNNSPIDMRLFRQTVTNL